MSKEKMSPSQRKNIFSWALYDWGNSAYSTTVMAAFFPVFLKEYWSAGTDAVVTTARLGFTISAASLFVAILSPTLGAMADLRGRKKTFCFVFTILGVISCGWMGFIPQGEWIWALAAYAIAMIAFSASAVFYDSLLPSVAEGKWMDYASALGYSFGYLGGGVLLSLNVAMVLFPATFGIASASLATKISFVMVAVWWLLFSIPLFKNVQEPKVSTEPISIFNLMKKSISALLDTLKRLKTNKNLLIFMMAYWLYIDGVYTVMTMAVDYGISIGFQSKDLILALLITQFIGFPCAYLFGRLGPRFGAKKPILVCILIYGITVVAATKMSTSIHFFMLAAVIGLVQGGVQSLSRSLFARMIPVESSGEYFGLFNLVGRFASILGPVVVGLGALLTGNSRIGMLGIIVLFISGGALLLFVNEPAEKTL